VKTGSDRNEKGRFVSQLIDFPRLTSDTNLSLRVFLIAKDLSKI
jgi:hypothetical protein